MAPALGCEHEPPVGAAGGTMWWSCPTATHGRTWWGVPGDAVTAGEPCGDRHLGFLGQQDVAQTHPSAGVCVPGVSVLADSKAWAELPQFFKVWVRFPASKRL